MAKDAGGFWKPTIGQALAAVGVLAALAGAVLLLRTGKPDQPLPAEVEPRVTKVEEPPKREEATLTPAPTQEVNVAEERREVTAPPPPIPVKPELILSEKPEEMPAHVKGTIDGITIYNNLVDVGGNEADPDYVIETKEGSARVNSVEYANDGLKLENLATLEWQQGVGVSYDSSGSRVSYNTGEGRFGYLDVLLAQDILVYNEQTAQVETFQFPHAPKDFSVNVFWVEGLELPTEIGGKAIATTVIRHDACEILRDEAGALLEKFADREELKRALEPLYEHAPTPEHIREKAEEIVNMFPSVEDIAGRIASRVYPDREQAIDTITTVLLGAFMVQGNENKFLDAGVHYTAECSDSYLDEMIGYLDALRPPREKIETGYPRTGEFSNDEWASYPTRDDVKAKFAEIIAELLPSAEVASQLLSDLSGLVPKRSEAQAMLDTMAALHEDIPSLATFVIKDDDEIFNQQRLENQAQMAAWEAAVLEAKVGYLAELQDWAVAIEELGYAEEAQTVRDEEIAPLRQELAGKGVELPSEPAKEKAKSTPPSEPGVEEGIDEEQAMAGVRVHQLASADRASGLPQQQV